MTFCEMYKTESGGCVNCPNRYVCNDSPYNIKGARKKREKEIVARLEYLNAELKARKALGDYNSLEFVALAKERLKLREELPTVCGVFNN